MIASVLALKALLIGLALWASLSDLRRMEIPNTVPVLIVLAFAVLVAPQIGIEATLWRLAVGGGMHPCAVSAVLEWGSRRG